MEMILLIEVTERGDLMWMWIGIGISFLLYLLFVDIGLFLRNRGKQVSCVWTGADAARSAVEWQGIIASVSSHAGQAQYIGMRREIRLNRTVYQNSDVIAVTTAVHEAAHAILHMRSKWNWWRGMTTISIIRIGGIIGILGVAFWLEGVQRHLTHLEIGGLSLMLQLVGISMLALASCNFRFLRKQEREIYELSLNWITNFLVKKILLVTARQWLKFTKLACTICYSLFAALLAFTIIATLGVGIIFRIFLLG